MEGDYTFTYNDEAVEFSKAVFDTHPSEDGCWWLCASTSGKMWDEYVYLSMFISPLVPGETEQQLDIEEFTFMLPLSSDSRNMAAGEFMLDGDICFALQEN